MSFADRLGAIGTSANWLRTWPRRYGFALLTVAVATLLRYALDVAFGQFPPFVMFFPAIILVAVLAGFAPGILATILSSASVAVFFWPSLNMFGAGRARETVGLLLFSVIGAGITGLATLYRRHDARLREFERVVENLEEMIVVLDRDYRYLIANRSFLNYRGMKKEDVIGRHVSEILNPEAFQATIKERLDDAFRGQAVQYEMRYQYPDRGQRDLLISYFPIAGRSGIDRVACVLQDITRLRAADHSLRLFRTLIDQSNDAVEVVDPETLRFLDVNEKACRDLGYTRGELLSMTVYDIDPHSNEAGRASIVDRLRKGEFVLNESVHRKKDGTTFPVENSMKHVSLDRDYVIVVSRDISRRKRSEAALRESEDRYRDLIEHSEDLVCTHDLEGNLISVNPAPARLLGYEVAEMLKIPMRELIAPEFQEKFEEYLIRIKNHGADKGLLCVMTRSGERRIWEYNNTLRTEGVASPVVRGMARDVTEQKKAEAALRTSEQRYRLLFDKNIAGVAISRNDQLVDCNDAWAHMLGYGSAEEICGRQTKDFYFDARDRAPLIQKLAQSDAPVSGEAQLRRKDGTPVWVLFNFVVPPGSADRTIVQATAIDITKRKQMENSLRRREEDYRSFVAHSSEGIFREDLDAPLPIDLPEDELVHRIIHESYLAECNDAMARMYGFESSKEFVGRRLTELMVADDPRNIAVTRDYVCSGFRLLDRESHEVGAQGNPKVFRNSITGIVENGKLVRTWGIQRDVTEQSRMEEAMRRNEERFRVALKDSPITVFNQDSDLRYTWIYNPQLYWQHEVLGKTDEEVLGPKKAAKLTDLKRRVLRTGTALREEVAVSNNGKSFAFDMSIEPLFAAAGEVVGITGACIDIARLREMADNLQDAKDKLTQAKSYLEREIETELGFETIIGQSAALRETLTKARVVAPTDSTVLLLGETGTGKELVARSVHGLSSRKDNTFVKLNCAAVPSGLLESELFGHEKGAFTSAVSQKVGRIELADKGTLFLDEIGELPLELQPKLLRVLQDREFERLGGVHTLRVDVRIIAATNRDLRQDIIDKKFREDLFYRLNVFPIELPPLRDRREDIPMLVHYFMRKHATRMGKAIAIIPDETMHVLCRWNWPGNIRELENMIERMVILSKGSVLAPPPSELSAPQQVAEDDLTELEREHIIRVLRDTHGVLSGDDGAASRLGLKRTTLQSMLKRFGIEAQEYRRANGLFGPG
ncbi:MAG TPA: PAS domain S-box protein [Candidatus Sulfotelmatobacter sp.]|nr:PAS domain S-box protein [Candidatus Sulfotelmatobacter sp.]